MYAKFDINILNRDVETLAKYHCQLLWQKLRNLIHLISHYW